jgi:hypothetical protein
MELIKKVISRIHGTTHEIPLQRLKDESLNPLSSVPAYMTRREESRRGILYKYTTLGRYIKLQG